MNNYDILRFKCAQVQLTWRRFTLTGSDVESFIQGQSTANIKELELNTFKLHAFIERTGKIETHFYLAKTTNSIELFVPIESASAIVQRFEKFVISEDVELKENGNEKWWVCLGPQTPNTGYAGVLGGERAALVDTQLTSIPVIEKELFRKFLLWQGEPTLDEAYHVGTLINQTRLFDLAVSLKKGCFTGQETVSKIYHNRGAAWAPVLLKCPVAIEVEQKEIVVSEKKVAQIHYVETTLDETWIVADVLRDVRVKGMRLQLDTKTQFEVQEYPRFNPDPEFKAKELFYRGTESFQKDDIETSLENWQEAITFAPAYPDPYEAIGVLLGRENKLDDAIAWMKKLLEVDSSSIMAHTNLSLFLMKQGKIEEAEEHKSLATIATFASFGRESQKKEEEENRKKQLLEEQSQREEMFKQVLEIDPEDPLANYGLGTLFFEREQFEKAQKLFETVIQSDPGYSVAYLGLGKVLIRLGEKKRAKEVLSNGVKVAAKKGEMMPANEMQSLIGQLS